MSEFKNSSSQSAEDAGNNSFFKRWRKGGVNVSIPRAVPGSLRVTSTKQSKPPGAGMEGSSVSSLIGSPIRPFSTSRADNNDFDINDESDNIRQIQATEKPYRIIQFENILNSENIDLIALRNLSWNGVPMDFKPMVWQLLLGYSPTNKSRRETTLARKRKEYQDSIPIYFDISDSERTTQEGETLRQILVDLPRTCPDTPLFHQQPVQKSMERILYIWAIRHPASGYVQGMSDLLTPLLLVSLFPHVDDVMRCDVATIEEKIIMDVEADAYWCLTKLLDNIQDHYTFSQPGLQRMVLRLEDLVHRIDSELHQHFENECLQYMQFSFRWMNCLLLRELPLRAILRLWDTYLSEERGGFENFHVYVCAVILKTYRDKLITMNFQDVLLFLQELPTTDWKEDEVQSVLSQAYILSTLFEDAPSHFT